MPEFRASVSEDSSASASLAEMAIPSTLLSISSFIISICLSAVAEVGALYIASMPISLQALSKPSKTFWLFSEGEGVDSLCGTEHAVSNEMLIANIEGIEINFFIYFFISVSSSKSYILY